MESETYIEAENQITSSEGNNSKKLQNLMNRNEHSTRSKQTKFGASKGISFNKSKTDRKLSLKLESLKSLNKLSNLDSTKNSQRTPHEEFLSRKGRLTSSNVPWTSRSPYALKKEFGLEDLKKGSHLKYSELMSKGKKGMRLDPLQFIREKSLKEKYRLEQIEQWKRENGHKKSNISSGKIPQQYIKKLEASGNGLANSYSGKEGLNHLYHKNKLRNKGGQGSFTSGQLNLKNFSSNTQMYNYGTAGHSNLNFSKNKFNMKQRLTNFMANSKGEKFYNRGYLRSNEHLMPEINKKKNQLLRELRGKKFKDEKDSKFSNKKIDLFSSKSKEALKKNLNLKYLSRKEGENQSKTDRKLEYGKSGDSLGKLRGSFKMNQQFGLGSSHLS